MPLERAGTGVELKAGRSLGKRHEAELASDWSSCSFVNTLIAPETPRALPPPEKPSHKP